MAKRRPTRSKPDDDSNNPFHDYVTLRGLSRRLRCSPTTASKLATDLNLPFVVILGRKKLYRLSAVGEALHAREQTLEQAGPRKAKPSVAN